VAPDAQVINAFQNQADPAVLAGDRGKVEF
jgi:hypothetical protein